MQRLVTWGPRRNNYYYESGKNNSDNVACNDAIIPHNFHSRRLGHPGTPSRRYASHHVIFLFFLWSLLIPIFSVVNDVGHNRVWSTDDGNIYQSVFQPRLLQARYHASGFPNEPRTPHNCNKLYSLMYILKNQVQHYHVLKQFTPFHTIW